MTFEDTICEVDATSKLASRTLAELGIPNYDIVQVCGAEESSYVLLAGDREFKNENS